MANEKGEVLNNVLTTAKGVSLQEMSWGIVERCRDAGEPEPRIIYVD